MPPIKHTKVGTGIKVLKADTYVRAGNMWWVLIIEKPMAFKAQGDAAPDGFATMAYHIPGFAFETKAAEYGFDDFEEVLEMVMYESFQEFDKLDDANPYEENEEICRSKKRSSIAKMKSKHSIEWAPEARQAFDMKVRFKPENIDVYKEVVVSKQRQTSIKSEKIIERQAFAALAANDEEDAGGPIVMAKMKKREREARDGARINGNKVALRGGIKQDLATGEIEISET